MDRTTCRVLVNDYSLDVLETQKKRVFTNPQAVMDTVKALATANSAKSVEKFFEQRELGASKRQYHHYKNGHRYDKDSQTNLPFTIGKLRDFAATLGVSAEDLVDFDRTYAFHGIAVGKPDPRYGQFRGQLNDALQEFVASKRRALLKELRDTLKNRLEDYEDARLRRLLIHVHMNTIAVEELFDRKRWNFRQALNYNKKLLREFHGSSEDCIDLAMLVRLALRLRLLKRGRLLSELARALKHLRKHVREPMNADDTSVYELLCCEQASYVYRAQKRLHEEAHEDEQASSCEEKMIKAARKSYRLNPSRPEAMLCYALAIRNAADSVREEGETKNTAELLLIKAAKLLDPAGVELARFYRFDNQPEKTIDTFNLYRNRWSTNSLLRESEIYAEAVKLMIYRSDYGSSSPGADVPDSFAALVEDAIRELHRSISAGLADFRKIAALAFLTYKLEGPELGLYEWRHLQLPSHRNDTWDVRKVIEQGIHYAELGRTDALREMYVAGVEHPMSWSVIGTFVKDCMGDDDLAIRCYAAGLKLEDKNVQLLLNHSRLLLDRNKADDRIAAIAQLKKAKRLGKPTRLFKYVDEELARAREMQAS